MPGKSINSEHLRCLSQNAIRKDIVIVCKLPYMENDCPVWYSRKKETGIMREGNAMMLYYRMYLF